MPGSGSLKKKIYKQLLEKIIGNEFPLDRFLVEGRLAEMFGVSRAPVREALVELCNENILRNIPRTGYQIVQISRKELRDALQLRSILELEAARLACDRLTEGDAQRLLALQEELRRIESGDETDLEEWVSSGSRVHLVIAELSGNALLHRMVEDVHRILRRASAQLFLDTAWPGRKRSVFHRQIVDALIQRNKEAAVELLARDLDVLREFLKEV